MRTRPLSVCNSIRETAVPPKPSAALFATDGEKLSLPRITWHGLRHFHAALLDAVGAPIGTVQALLGGSNRQAHNSEPAPRSLESSGAFCFLLNIYI